MEVSNTRFEDAPPPPDLSQDPVGDDETPQERSHVVLRSTLSARDRLALLSLPVSGFAARTLAAERMRLALGALAWIEGRDRATGAVSGIMRAARNVDLDDFELTLRSTGSVEVMMDVNFLLRPIAHHRADPKMRVRALRELEAALVETAPNHDAAVAALLLTGVGLDGHLGIAAADLRRATRLWRATDPSLARAFEAHDALRAMWG